MKLQRNNLPREEKRTCILTFLVKGGTDTGYAGELTGKQIELIESILEKAIPDEKQKGGSTNV